LLVLGLGSNLGDRESTLSWALGELARLLGDLRVASLYRSSPVPISAQPEYLNTVAVGERVRLARPEDVLAVAKALELAAGRRPAPRWAPRPLDVDLLLWGERQRAGPSLTLPHPALRRRRFVLAPLTELEPDLRLPPDGAKVADVLHALGDDQPITRRPWRLRPPVALPPAP